jgi:MFS family permease
MIELPRDAGTTPRLTPLQWVICGVAALGFAFDIYEVLMLPLVVGPALTELGGIAPGTPAFNAWVGWFFWVPALAGGVFGLLGGYLTDLLGRRRVLVWSILLYALSAFAAGFAPSVEWLLALRCLTFIGICVEFVAAVAWLAELFPDAVQRERVIGFTQAFSSCGGIMVTVAYYLAVTWADALPPIHGHHAAWRYTLISGVIPAIPLILIRPFLPESPTWAARKAAGTLKRPSIAELFAPALRRTTLVTTIMFACSYAASFGALQHLPRIVPGLPEVRELARPVQQQIVSVVQSFQEAGGLLGRVLLAILAVRVVSRRRLLRIFQLPGLLVVPLVFLFPARESLELVKWGALASGLLIVSQFSFWGNYLPRVYPTYLRGTGESFAANVGGRMIGTSAAIVTTTLANLMPGSPAEQLAVASALVALLAFGVGALASRWLPEPESGLPD